MIENDVLFSNDTGILGKRNSEFSQQESNLRLWLVSKIHATFSANQKQNQCETNRSQAFSRAWRQLHVFVSHSDWSNVLFKPIVIGQNAVYQFGFSFTTLNWKPSLLTLIRKIKLSSLPSAWVLIFSRFFSSTLRASVSKRSASL